MDHFRIRNEHLPSRCEICHQADLFDPATGQCLRCADVLGMIPVWNPPAPVPTRPVFSLFGNSSPLNHFHVRAGVASVVVGGLLMSPIVVSMTRSGLNDGQPVRAPRFSVGKPFLSRAIVNGWRTVDNLNVRDNELPVLEVTGSVVSLELDEFLAGAISLRTTDGEIRTFHLSRIPELNEYEREEIRALLEAPGALVNAFFQELPGGTTALNRLRISGQQSVAGSQ
jgi:hypothetical protein